MTQNRQQTKSSANGVDASLARPGGLSYLEIPAGDARRSAAFYEKVFGWTVSGGDTDYPKFSDLTGHLIGRWVTGRAISREPGLLPYIYVDRIEMPGKGCAMVRFGRLDVGGDGRFMSATGWPGCTEGRATVAAQGLVRDDRGPQGISPKGSGERRSSKQEIEGGQPSRAALNEAWGGT